MEKETEINADSICATDLLNKIMISGCPVWKSIMDKEFLKWYNNPKLSSYHCFVQHFEYERFDSFKKYIEVYCQKKSTREAIISLEEIYMCNPDGTFSDCNTEYLKITLSVTKKQYN